MKVYPLPQIVCLFLHVTGPYSLNILSILFFFNVLLIVFFDLYRIELAEFVLENTIVSSECSKGILKHFGNNQHRQQPEEWVEGFILYHDTAVCHTLLLEQQFLSTRNMMVSPHPLHSPDLALSNFWNFFKVKRTMRGQCSEFIQNMAAATTKRTSTTASDHGKNNG